MSTQRELITLILPGQGDEELVYTLSIETGTRKHAPTVFRNLSRGLADIARQHHERTGRQVKFKLRHRKHMDAIVISADIYLTTITLISLNGSAKKKPLDDTREPQNAD